MGKVIDRLWDFFSSVKLALVLMLVLTGLGLIGALLIQAPPDVISDPIAYEFWLEDAAIPKYGAWTPLLSLLRFFDMFHSPWFLGAGALLVISILVCSLNRWQSLRLTLSGGPVKLGESFYTSGNTHRELATRATSPQEAITRVLTRHRYRIRTEQHQDKFYLAADKYRSFRLATYVSHLSIILFIIGFLIGSYFGFRNMDFIVAEGARQDVGYDTNLSLYLESFVDEYYEDGAPKDYRSQVKLYENGAEVKSATIRVNHPMIYNGVRFYQSFFGPAVKVQVKSPTGEVLLNDVVLMTQVLQSRVARRNAGEFQLPQLGLTGRFISSATNTFDPMIGEGELGVELSQGGRAIALDKMVKGTPHKVVGLEFTYLDDAQYSGFQVSRDPGNALIWIASSLFIIGIGLVLYFPYKQVWVMLQSRSAGGSRLLVRSAAPRSFNAASDFKSLIGEIENELAKKKA